MHLQIINDEVLNRRFNNLSGSISVSQLFYYNSIANYFIVKHCGRLLPADENTVVRCCAFNTVQLLNIARYYNKRFAIKNSNIIVLMLILLTFCSSNSTGLVETILYKSFWNVYSSAAPVYSSVFNTNTIKQQLVCPLINNDRVYIASRIDIRRDFTTIRANPRYGW